VPGFYDTKKEGSALDDKYIRQLRRMAQDRSLTPEAAERLLRAHANDWEESKHPRGKGGKFAPKGSGSASGGGSEGEKSSVVTSEGPSSEKKSVVSTSAGPIAMKKPGKYARKPEKGSGIAGMVRAKRITQAGEASLGSKCAEMDSGDRFAPKPGEMREGQKFAEGSAFNHPQNGKPTKSLPKGTGATKLSTADLFSEKKPDARHTVCQYLDDEGHLTPEREKLHAQAVDNLFAGKQPVAPGEKKTFTMFGGGSASGKGGLSDPKRCKDFQSSFFTGGTPGKDTVATIDSDELKKDLPEYREMMETDPDHAAAVAHEESSAIAKRGMQAAMDNGYNFTLDGTGDGSVEGVRKKIQQARERGYEVNACYVTCPTEMAVQRSIDRGKRTGRNVPLDAVRSIHSKVSHIFPKVASDFDHVALFDTSGGKPVLIAECERGKEIRIVDQKRYDAFLAKDQEPDD